MAIFNKNQMPKYGFENLERMLRPSFRLFKESASGQTYILTEATII